MKHIIIVTASTGGGHNSAACNLKKSFEERGIYAQIIDMFKLSNKMTNAIMVEGYRILADKMPKTYGMIYDLTDHKNINKLVSQSFFINTLLRLGWLLHELEPDLVIAVHGLGAQIIGKLKQKGRFKAPFMQIVTDFKAHNAYMHQDVDAYIVASQYTCDSLIKMGADQEKIYIYGIPTKQEFYTNSSHTFLENGLLHLLIMGDSMGLCAMRHVIDQLVSLDFSDKLRLSIICGKNEELLVKLNRDYQKRIQDKSMIVYGFVDNMAELMESSDLIISKPGGLTSSEAINKCIPMIIPFVIPGQERENAEFLVEYNMAIEIKDMTQLGEYLQKLIEHPEIYIKMVNNMERLNKTYSIEKIVDLGISLMNR